MCYDISMKQLLKLDTSAIQDEVRRQVAKARRMGAPLFYIKDGKMIEERPSGSVAKAVSGGKREELSSV